MSNLSDNGNAELPEIIRTMMESPEIAGIIKSLKSESSDSPTEAQAQDAPVEKAASGEAPSISPEMLAKLPAVMSVLSGMGIGKAEPEKSGKSADHPSGGGDRQRKALLGALKPYLSERRRTVVDGMMQLGNITELFQTFRDVK